MDETSRREVVFPIQLGLFNVFLTVFSEILILTLGTLLTQQLYAILIKRRIHNGKSARLTSGKWLKLVPFGDDLAFDAHFERLFCAALRILLVILTLIASMEVGSRRSFETIGTAERQLVVNQEPQTWHWNYGSSSLPVLAKQGCEQINSTHVTYKAALYSSLLGRFTCGTGSFGEEEYILSLKWNNDGIPPIAMAFNVKHNIFNYTTGTFMPSNATVLATGSGQFLQFLKAGPRYFLLTTIRGRVSIEIVKPRLEDVFVFSANQINHDRANSISPGISVARSLSNHLITSRNSTQLMTGSAERELATMSLRGIIVAAVDGFIVFIVLPGLLLILRRQVSYIRVDPTDSLGIASLCVEDPWTRCTENIESIEFGITDRGSEQHLGILPKSTSPSRRNENKPMCKLPETPSL